jgi:hypothetical protein
VGNDHEVEFHEIEIMIMRSKLCLFVRSNFDQEVDTSIIRSKLPNNLINNNAVKNFRSHDCS